MNTIQLILCTHILQFITVTVPVKILLYIYMNKENTGKVTDNATFAQWPHSSSVKNPMLGAYKTFHLKDFTAKLIFTWCDLENDYVYTKWINGG